MAKSVHDAGWAMLKTMLDYKCAHAGNVFIEVDEKHTTQTCSECGSKPDSRPKGIAGLGIREWTCDSCGEHHDRDINAAKNILAVGYGRLAEGIPVPLGRGGCQRNPKASCLTGAWRRFFFAFDKPSTHRFLTFSGMP